MACENPNDKNLPYRRFGVPFGNEAIARLSQPSENLHVIEGHVDGVESNTLNNVKKLENINDISVDKDNTCEGSWNNKNCTDISDINVPEGHDGESLATF